MKKKRVTALVGSLSLVAVIGIGATLAYFTDQTDTQFNNQHGACRHRSCRA